MVTIIIKCVSLPVLLIASMFSRFASSYELIIDCLICLAAILFVQRAVWSKEYSWAAGFAAIVVVFSPLLLVIKIPLLMSFAGIAMLLTLVATFRMQPEPAA
jgi:hypothetical protein